MSAGCLGADTLCDFLEGRADPDARARIERHASKCAACRHILSSLARSGTLSAVPSEPALDVGGVLVPGMQVGRYVIVDAIGAGAMGVVHAAFDPSLERRIALKVLRGEAATSEARDRLLREARAMARLSHPNVVTVHEVGTTVGRDFVVMELINGGTLAEWLCATRPALAAILDAFLAAGRGLAAAHAAGIVHRDFKPHNVLRSRGGRIVVTDFGLALEVNRALEGTWPIGGDHRLPGASSRITVTGSVLGTPSYMAPEQWRGGAATPAADQFAYCVALWEALASERPYRGPSLDDLRDQVTRGPSALDASKIPRRLRAILRRGLDPDPAQRWPNMDALLTQIVRVERRRGIVLAVGGGALLAAAALVVAMRGGGQLAARPGCEPSALDPGQVWSPKAHAGVGKQAVAAALLDREIATWDTARAAACKVEPVLLAPRLSCLDSVLARIDAVARGARVHRDGPQIDAGALLIDPKVCELARTPRLMASTSPAFLEVVAAWLAHTATPVPLPASAAGALVARAAADPCASSLAHVLVADTQKTTAERSHQLDEAQQDAERCGDDRILAETAIAMARYTTDSEWLSATVTAKLRIVDSAVHRVDQRDLTAQIDLIRVQAAARAENVDEAIARGGAAMEGFATRGRLRAQFFAGLTVLRLRQIRATAADVTAVPALLARWRASAVAQLGEGDEIVRALDTRAAEWVFAHGDVATNRYEIIAPVAPDGSFMVDGVPRHEVRVFAAIDGLTQHLMSGTHLVVRGPVVRGIALSLARSTRAVHVIVRNTVTTKLTSAEVLVLPGRVPSMSFLEIKRQFHGGSISIRYAHQLEGEHVPSRLVEAAQPGDLFATMTEVPDGVASACAFALPEVPYEEFMRKMYAHYDKLQVICTEFHENAEFVTLEVPPPPRFD